MKHVWFLDDAFYILPQVDCVVVGGTQQRGDERTAADAADAERIWATVTERWPALRGAEVVSDWVRRALCCWPALALHPASLCVLCECSSASIACERSPLRLVSCTPLGVHVPTLARLPAGGAAARA